MIKTDETGIQSIGVLHGRPRVHDHHVGALPVQEAAVHLHSLGGAAHSSVAEEVAAVAGPGAQPAAVGVEVLHFHGLAQPARDAEKG